MAISGMTGFSRHDGAGEGARWSWEARSVNGKGLDVKIKLPFGFEALDPMIKDACAKRFKRGSVQVGLSLRREVEAASGAQLDHAFLEAMIAAGQPYVERGEVTKPSWDGLLALRGAFTSGEPAPAEEALGPALQALLLDGLAVTLDGLAVARAQEGRALEGLLAGHLQDIARLVTAAEGAAQGATEALRDKVRKRIETLLGDVPLDPQRVAQEAAILASKADVREELDRLAAHVREAQGILAGDGPAGRKLDFLVQELNREANTLCSKASEMALTQIGLDLKAVIDQFREQSANVE